MLKQRAMKVTDTDSWKKKKKHSPVASLWKKSTQTFEVSEQIAELSIVGCFCCCFLQSKFSLLSPLCQQTATAARAERQLHDSSEAQQPVSAHLIVCLPGDPHF